RTTHSSMIWTTLARLAGSFTLLAPTLVRSNEQGSRAEAQRENVPLSEVERKMLYFTESGWTLPDIMKVSEDFDREYDQAKYEQKIAKLVTKANRRIRKGSREDYDRWWAAIRFLQREDHYISVMIRLAGLR